MRTDNKPIYHGDQVGSFQAFDGTPESSFATPWLLGDQGLFRVYVAIIRVESEKSKDYLPLAGWHTKRVLETIPYLVESLEQKAGR